jgi:membrane-bound metal-dependent hydrolase YbcI (DUF457 family)
MRALTGNAIFKEQRMPLPIGHTAIGLAAFETARSTHDGGSRPARFLFIMILANMPDIDIVLGLILQGNGAAYHRGPTHSLLFAVVFGFLASHLWRLERRIPRMGFGLCSLLIFSHVAADMFLTSTPVSFFWPLEIYWTQGHSNWGQVFNMVIFKSIQDVGIAVAAMIYVLALRFMRSAARRVPGRVLAGGSGGVERGNGGTECAPAGGK